MITSDSLAAMAPALAKAQSVMEGARKASNNPAFNSKYANLEAVVDAVKEPLTTNGISYVQFPCTNDKDEVGVETMLLHSSGEWIRSEPYFVPVKKADAQGFGSAITYCRRYSLLAACGIAPEDDDGNAAAKARPLKAPIPSNVEGIAYLANAEPDEQQWVREQAMTIMGKHKDKAPAVELLAWIEAQHYQPEQKLAIWSLLPSDVRTPLQKAARPAPALAEQA
jgi:hypothetical protein